MIPKIIHYCWFGHNPKPEIVNKCIESWQKFCPDYEIREWNEENFDYTQCQYAADAYKEKKWGFVSDYARLKIIYDLGGIYLDTDVELLKNLDPLLNTSAVMGFENEQYVATGLIIMAEAHNSIIKTMYELYYTQSFYNKDGTLNMIPCPKYNTEVLIRYGLRQNNTEQIISDGVSQVTVFPTEYFCPMDCMKGEIKCTEHTYCIHHYIGSWVDEFEKKIIEYHRYIYNKYKKKWVCAILAHLFYFRLRISVFGLYKTIKYYIKRIVK